MTAAVLLLVGALAVWPGSAAAERLRAVDAGSGAWRRGRWDDLRRMSGRVPESLVLPLSAAVAGLLMAGPLHAAAAAVLAAAAADLRSRSRDRRGGLERLGAWERALDDAASALRAGARPEQALDRAADAAEAGDPGVARLLSAAGAHARLGGDVAAALRTGVASGGRDAVVAGRAAGAGRADGMGSAGRIGRLGPVRGGVATGRDDRVAEELAGAWLLAARHGVELADVVDGLRADVAARRERALRVDATLAGPRATAVILTALPALGVLLGSGFGADPLGVLFGGVLGGALCLVGAVFLTAGLLWTDRIAGGAAR